MADPAAIRADLTYGLSGDGGGSLQAALDAGLALGPLDLQFSAALSDGDTQAQAYRLILSRAVSPPLRLGLSVGQVDGADPTKGLSLGLHGLFQRPGLRIEGDLIKPPDDDATNGVLVATIRARQDIAPGWQLRGELFRRSTDTEEADLSAALLGFERDFGNGAFGFAELSRSGADSRAFLHDGLRLGGGWNLDSGLSVRVAGTVRTGDDGTDTGLTIGLHYEPGASDGLFRPGPLPDLIGYGAD